MSRNDSWARSLYPLIFNSHISEGEDGRSIENLTIKLKHSLRDASEFNRVVEGKYKNKDLDEILNDENASNIKKCYAYFRKSLRDLISQGNRQIITDNIIKKLTVETRKCLVIINLENGDNEQEIFDSINSAGVKLTCADIIKNAIYNKFVSLYSKQFDIDSARQEAGKLYDKTWGKIFEFDSESKEDKSYWLEMRNIGKSTERTKIEYFLQAFGIIKGIYDPNNKEHKLDKMADLYKLYIDDLDLENLKNFINDLCSYATLYKEYFIDLSAKIKNYGCFYQDKNLDKTKNIIIQTIQILGYFNTSTFESYVLKVINEKSREDQYNILKILNTYLIRNYIVDGKIDNNYNKEAAKLTNGAETIEHFMKMNSLDDNKIKMTLSNKVENNPAKLVLYWIELYHNYKRNGDKKYSRLVCNYQLEHVMPQKWEENWKIQYPEKDNDGNELSQEEKDKIKKELNEKRYHAIYQIGNMTLLIGTKNDELGNASFENKINGFKCKNGKFISGLKDSSTLIISKDILDKNEWSEDTIQDRTDSIYEAFISIWPVDPKIFLD